MPTIAEQVRIFARSEWGSPNPPAIPEDIRDFEAKHQLILPEAVSALYFEMNGCDTWGDNLLALWPLDKVGPVSGKVASYRGIPDYGEIVNTLPNAHEYFAFADHFIWLSVFAVRLRPAELADTNVIWICGPEWGFSAKCFEAFWTRIINEPNSLPGLY